MFRNTFTTSLRGYRWAVLAWGMGLGVVVYAQYATFAKTFGSSSAPQIQQLVNQFQFFGEAVKVGTPGGFVTFKVMGLLPVALGVWTVLAGARMLRGEEERGVLDVVLATPRSRSTIVTQKVLALATGVLVISLLIALWTMLGMGAAQVTVDPARAVVASLDAGMVAFMFGLLALLLAQFMSRAAAAGWTGGLMALSFVVEGTGRAMSGAAGLRRISPLYYYDRNLPLVPGYTPNWGAFALLAILCLVLAGAAIPLFLRRDVGRTVLADLTVSHSPEIPAVQAVAREARVPWLRDIGLQAIRRRLVMTLWWTAALALFAGYLVVVAKSSERQFEKLLGNSWFIKQIFTGTNIGTNSGFVSVLVFGYVPLLLALFAGFLAQRWVTDLDSGRLELVLATPRSRRRIIVARYGAVLAAVVVTTICVWLAIVLFARSIGFSLDAGRVAEACAGMLPLALITASLVFLLAELVPPGVVLGVTVVFLVVSYLFDLLRTLLSLPSWAVNLSIFRQYGTPILTGLNWEAFVAMLAIAGVMLALGTRQFLVRDVR